MAFQLPCGGFANAFWLQVPEHQSIRVDNVAYDATHTERIMASDDPMVDTPSA